MRSIFVLIGALFLSACTWEMYEDTKGKTQLRSKYPMGTGIYYTKGEASPNLHFHRQRHEPHALVQEKEK